MKLKTILLQLILVFLAIVPIKFHSQITISNIPEIDKIKQGTTFFAMKDPTSPKAAAFVEAITKNWTFSKVACIKYTDVEKNIAPNNAFVTITGNMTTTNNNTDTRTYLEVWTTNGKFVYDPKKRKHFNQQDKIQLATLELFTDFVTQTNPSSLYRIDYDASGHIKNWGEGIVGNYVQALNAYLKKRDELTLKTEINNKEVLKKLITETLYIPDYVLTKFNKSNGDETKKQEEKALFEGYTLAYKVLSTKDLNSKIVNDKTPFNYLLLINSGNEKYVTVTNSISGEIIYSAISNGFGNLKTSDLKELLKAIQKK